MPLITHQSPDWNPFTHLPFIYPYLHWKHIIVKVYTKLIVMF